MKKIYEEATILEVRETGAVKIEVEVEDSYGGHFTKKCILWMGAWMIDAETGMPYLEAVKDKFRDLKYSEYGTKYTNYSLKF